MLKLTCTVLTLSMVMWNSVGKAAEPISVSEYVQMKRSMASDKSYTLIKYLSGVADALYGTNLVLAGQGKSPPYCFGAARPLTATELIQYIDALLFDQLQKRQPVPGNYFIAVVAANAVGVALRCS